MRYLLRVGRKAGTNANTVAKHARVVGSATPATFACPKLWDRSRKSIKATSPVPSKSPSSHPPGAPNPPERFKRSGNVTPECPFRYIPEWNGSVFAAMLSLTPSAMRQCRCQEAAAPLRRRLSPPNRCGILWKRAYADWRGGEVKTVSFFSSYRRTASDGYRIACGRSRSYSCRRPILLSKVLKHENHSKLAAVVGVRRRWLRSCGTLFHSRSSLATPFPESRIQIAVVTNTINASASHDRAAQNLS